MSCEERYAKTSVKRGGTPKKGDVVKRGEWEFFEKKKYQKV